MQNMFKLAAVAALCATAAVAQAGVTFDANVENNTDFQKSNADSVVNGGRVEINANAELAKNGDMFVTAKGTYTLKFDGTHGLDDAWLKLGNSSADLTIGRFEGMDLFPMGKDVAPNIAGGYGAGNLRGRFNSSKLHALVGVNAGPARIELGLVTKKAPSQADLADPSYSPGNYGLRPTVQFGAGALTVKAGFESFKADDGSKSSSGFGLTAGYAMDSSTSFNVNFARNKDKDSSFGLNAAFGDAGVGFVQRKDAAGDKATSIYGAYTFPLFGVKGASITPAIGFTKKTGSDSDTAFRIRMNYAF